MTVGDDDPLVRSVRTRRARRQWLARDGAPSAARHLAQVGVLGWIIVVPMLGGVFAGRWLDGRLGTGLTCTGLLLMLGVALAGWSAWRWVQAA